MRSRALALFVALVVGLFCGWSGFAGQGPQLPGVATLMTIQDSGRETGAGQDLAEPAEPAEAIHGAEPLGQGLAEGAPDLPGLFLASLGAFAPAATMARPRPHGAAAWQHLYLNTPRRPPRASPVIT
jgi:hypothetical protein